MPIRIVIAFLIAAQSLAAADVEDLLRQLRHGDSQTRIEAARSLADLGAGSAGAAALGEALRDPDVNVRRAAFQALIRMGSDAEPAVEAIAAAVEDQDAQVRSHAVQVLARLRTDEQAVATIARVLREDPEEQVRVAAARALGTAGRSGSGASVAAAALRAALRDGGEQMRYSASSALGMLGPAAGEDASLELLRILDDPESGLRTQAARALGMIGLAPQSAVPALAAVLADPARPAHEKSAAASSLGAYRQHARPAIPDLVRLLSDSEESLRQIAARSLLRIDPRPEGSTQQELATYFSSFAGVRGAAEIPEPDPEAVRSAEKLAAALAAGQDPATLVQALDLLTALGPAAAGTAEAIGPLLKNEASSVREAARAALVRIGPEGAAPLGAVLADEDEEIRSNAAQGLLELDDRAAPALDLIVSALERSRDANEQATLARILGALGSLAEPSVGLLAELLGADEQPAAAASALGRIGCGARSATPALVEALRAEDAPAWTVQAAVQALPRIACGESEREAAVAAALHRFKNSSDEHSRAAMLMVLARLRADSDAVVAAAIDALNDSQLEVRRRGAELLQHSPEKAAPAVGRLIELLGDDAESVRRSSAYALGRIPAAGEQSAQALVKALKDSSEPVRAACATSLGHLSAGRDVAVPGLLEALADSFDSVREMAIISLVRLAGDDAAVRQRIEQMAVDPSPRIQRALAFARDQTAEGR